MRVVLTFLAMLGLFLAGILFAIQQAVAVMLLAVCMVGAGLLYASAETHGFEGQYAPLPAPWTWETVSKLLYRLNEAKARFFNNDRLYVQTPEGPRAVTGLWYARVNHEMSIVLDVREPVAPIAHDFNRAKQGVM